MLVECKYDKQKPRTRGATLRRTVTAVVTRDTAFKYTTFSCKLSMDVVFATWHYKAAHNNDSMPTLQTGHDIHVKKQELI